MNQQNQNNLNGQFLPGRKHPTTWEQNYAIVFDLTSKRIYKADRSDIDSEYLSLSPSNKSAVHILLSSPPHLLLLTQGTNFPPF